MKKNHRLKSYTSKGDYANQFPQFFPVKKIWNAALVDSEISDRLFSLAIAICVAKWDILTSTYKMMIAKEYLTVVNKSSVTAFHAVRMSLIDCKVSE